MPLFVFEARTGAGQAQRGTEEAPSATALVNTLRQRGWLVVGVKPSQADGKPIGDWLPLLNPLNWLSARSADVELSLQQMAVMLRSGLTLLTSLKTVAEYARRPAMRRVWEAVAEKIQQGSSLQGAMASHRCFPHLVVELVRVGEQTGTLEQVISRAAEALERRRLLKTQLLTALAYPTIVLVAAIAVTVFMTVNGIADLLVSPGGTQDEKGSPNPPTSHPQNHPVT
jgi:type II secretory pathway component PulF